eukprot:Clim_evm32s6 gene=Clim_evmTU32s6
MSESPTGRLRVRLHGPVSGFQSLSPPKNKSRASSGGRQTGHFGTGQKKQAPDLEEELTVESHSNALRDLSGQIIDGRNKQWPGSGLSNMQEAKHAAHGRRRLEKAVSQDSQARDAGNGDGGRREGHLSTAKTRSRIAQNLEEEIERIERIHSHFCTTDFPDQQRKCLGTTEENALRQLEHQSRLLSIMMENSRDTAAKIALGQAPPAPLRVMQGGARPSSRLPVHGPRHSGRSPSPDREEISRILHNAEDAMVQVSLIEKAAKSNLEELKQAIREDQDEAKRGVDYSPLDAYLNQVALDRARIFPERQRYPSPQGNENIPPSVPRPQARYAEPDIDTRSIRVLLDNIRRYREDFERNLTELDQSRFGMVYRTDYSSEKFEVDGKGNQVTKSKVRAGIKDPGRKRGKDRSVAASTSVAGGRVVRPKSGRGRDLGANPPGKTLETGEGLSNEYLRHIYGTRSVLGHPSRITKKPASLRFPSKPIPAPDIFERPLNKRSAAVILRGASRAPPQSIQPPTYIERIHSPTEQGLEYPQREIVHRIEKQRAVVEERRPTHFAEEAGPSIDIAGYPRPERSPVKPAVATYHRFEQDVEPTPPPPELPLYAQGTQTLPEQWEKETFARPQSADRPVSPVPTPAMTPEPAEVRIKDEPFSPVRTPAPTPPRMRVLKSELDRPLDELLNITQPPPQPEDQGLPGPVLPVATGTDRGIQLTPPLPSPQHPRQRQRYVPSPLSESSSLSSFAKPEGHMSEGEYASTMGSVGEGVFAQTAGGGSERVYPRAGFLDPDQLLGDIAYSELVGDVDMGHQLARAILEESIVEAGAAFRPDGLDGSEGEVVNAADRKPNFGGEEAGEANAPNLGNEEVRRQPHVLEQRYPRQPVSSTESEGQRNRRAPEDSDESSGLAGRHPAPYTEAESEGEVAITGAAPHELAHGGSPRTRPGDGGVRGQGGAVQQDTSRGEGTFLPEKIIERPSIQCQ